MMALRPTGSKTLLYIEINFILSLKISFQPMKLKTIIISLKTPT
ncbi:hypothetical protein CLMAG_62510 [Clostridium magnum DSM 2767]|uniref:Uncharacterized protein n=1 Tax=Clostridium magnum DSM 2767 TaxID=1121326 RepID=A0A162QFH1_9CLOT|nr:hypothetical protein CLMAG_62510 [Clostridium magnum DSM 2767]